MLGQAAPNHSPNRPACVPQNGHDEVGGGTWEQRQVSATRASQGGEGAEMAAMVRRWCGDGSELGRNWVGTG